jgi:hypothetical protein
MDQTAELKKTRRRQVTLEFVYIFNLAGTGICVRYLGGSGGVEIPVLPPALAGVSLHLHHAADLATTLANEDDLLLRSICSTLEKKIEFENRLGENLTKRKKFPNEI